MKLYHGTSSVGLEEIKNLGIMPRYDSQRGEWEGTLASRADCVYLSRDYALWHAMKHSLEMIQQGIKGVLWEVDVEQLDQTLLRPDEDFLRQYRQILRWLASPAEFAQDSGGATLTAHERGVISSLVDPSLCDPTRISDDIDAHANLWHLSLERFGTVAYKGVVPPNALTRYFEIDLPRVSRIHSYVGKLELAMFKMPFQRDQIEGLMRLIVEDTPLVKPQPNGLFDLNTPFMRERIWTTDEAAVLATAERGRGVREYLL